MGPVLAADGPHTPRGTSKGAGSQVAGVCPHPSPMAVGGARGRWGVGGPHPLCREEAD